MRLALNVNITSVGVEPFGYPVAMEVIALFDSHGEIPEAQEVGEISFKVGGTPSAGYCESRVQFAKVSIGSVSPHQLRRMQTAKNSFSRWNTYNRRDIAKKLKKCPHGPTLLDIISQANIDITRKAISRKDQFQLFHSMAFPKEMVVLWDFSNFFVNVPVQNGHHFYDITCGRLTKYPVFTGTSSVFARF